MLWANEYITEKLGGDYVGKPCWEIFLGSHAPSPFCPRLTENDAVYEWDFFDPVHRRWMKVKHLVFRQAGILYRAVNINMMDDVMGLNLETVQALSQLQTTLTQKRAEMARLTQKANIDTLTGLGNRNRFQQDLERECTDVPGIGVLFLDLNNLKQINDRFRHTMGDALLRRVAQALCGVQEQMPRARCYRIGGDEFVLLLTRSTQQALDLCRQLFELALETANRGAGASVQCCGGAGIFRAALRPGNAGQSGRQRYVSL